VDEALAVRAALDALHSRYSRSVIEQAAIAGALNPEVLSNPENAAQAASYIARRLDAISEETERGWTGSPIADGGLTFTREVRGVKESWTIDGKLIASADALRLDRKAAHLQDIYAKSAKLKRKDAETVIHGPLDLLEAVFAAGRKGVTLQRYKGLGEMNPEQLWETTLDANARTLLKVHIRELDEADDIFTKLMGDIVEPRREFIRDNALSVANLDV
jgi:DNA gyrase subunit B